MRSRGFKPKRPAGYVPKEDRVRSIPKPEPGAFRLGVAVQSTVVSIPKPEKLRNPALLKLARGESCMLQIPGVCNRDVTTSVQCHSNLGVHGKGKSTKAHDCCSFSGCSACHFWLDQDGTTSYEHKRAATMLALARQIERWRQWLQHTKNSSAQQRTVASWALSNLLALNQSSEHRFDECVKSELLQCASLLLQ